MLLHSEDKIFRSLSDKYAEKDFKLDERKKLSLIEKDLQSLSLKNQEVSHPLEFNNEHEALGAMYVIEGSTFGGNVIAKQLSKTEGFDEVTFNFSDAIRKIQGPMWKNFKEVLDTEIAKKTIVKCFPGRKNYICFY